MSECPKCGAASDEPVRPGSSDYVCGTAASICRVQVFTEVRQ